MQWGSPGQAHKPTYEVGALGTRQLDCQHVQHSADCLCEGAAVVVVVVGAVAAAAVPADGAAADVGAQSCQPGCAALLRRACGQHLAAGFEW